MITPPPLINANPGDPITSEKWNNIVEALQRLYAEVNKAVGSLIVRVVNQANNNFIGGAIVTVRPTETDLARPTTRPVRAALFVGGGLNEYHVDQLLAGTYDVSIEAAGFNSETRSITMPSDGNPMTITVPMVAAQILTPVPNFFGMTLAQAVDEVHLRGFHLISVIDSHGKVVPAEPIPEEAKAATVLGQVPDPETLLPPRSPIRIHISAKAEYAERVKAPDLRGLTLENAKAALESLNLVLGETVTVRTK